MSLRVLRPGTFSLFVDRGRPGTRSLGVPLGGAADRAAYAIGNALAGNSSDAVALEMTYSGPSLLAMHDVSACVFGAPFSCSIDGREVVAGALFRLRAGETLTIGNAARGARAYLCVRGGFKVPAVLGSASSFTTISEGDQLPCGTSNIRGRSLAAADTRSLLDETASDDAIRVVDGPQSGWFAPQSLEGKFTVSPSSDRMGIRLEGKPLAREPRELISEAIAPGAIQVANDGLPIVLGVDGQTIGGYPKIAHVIRADLDRVAQFRPGKAIRFIRIGLEEAEASAAARLRALRKWVTALRIAEM
jgi:5-oxoprolinase (ATP-hydrolysing) subunit C